MKQLSSYALRHVGLYLASLLSLSLLVSHSYPVRAQSTTSGGLTGVVTDPSNALVPDADVSLTDNAKGNTLSKETTRKASISSLSFCPQPTLSRSSTLAFKRQSTFSTFSWEHQQP